MLEKRQCKLNVSLHLATGTSYEEPVIYVWEIIHFLKSEASCYGSHVFCKDSGSCCESKRKSFGLIGMGSKLEVKVRPVRWMDGDMEVSVS